LVKGEIAECGRATLCNVEGKERAGRVLGGRRGYFGLRRKERYNSNGERGRPGGSCEGRKANASSITAAKKKGEMVLIHQPRKETAEEEGEMQRPMEGSISDSLIIQEKRGSWRSSSCCGKGGFRERRKSVIV